MEAELPRPGFLDSRTLRSRVARRIFAVFVGCALLPVAAFALFSWLQVREQLERDAGESLRRASKAAGMSILERLLVAEQAVTVLAAELPGEPGGRLDLDDGRLLSIGTLTPEQEARLDARQRRGLDAGASVLRTLGGSPHTLVQLLRRREPDRPRSPVLVADLDPEFVFEPRQRAAGDGYRVEDEQGHALFAAAMQPGAEDAPAPTFSAAWTLFLASRFVSPSWTVRFSRSTEKVHRPLRRFEALFPLVALAACGVAVLMSLVQVRRSLVPVDALTEAARRISGGDMHARVEITSRDEFGELARTFNDMADEIGHQIAVLNAVNEIGAALSAEPETEALLDRILRGATYVTGASGGAIFLHDEATGLELARFWYAPRPELADVEIHSTIAQRCLERRATRVVNDPEALDEDEARAWRRLTQQVEIPIRRHLAVPMLGGHDEAVGVLLLFRGGADAEPFTVPSCRLAESLASQAATAFAKNRLVEGFRALFEGVVDLTVRAIDEKSPYTGDHCRKVPILTELIADAACGAASGPFKDFELGPDERYELRIAALLHDCGKVVTPVHVMDKATKLETIFDRIELVRTRFEVARRDMLLEARHSGGTEAPELAERLRRLDEDAEFLRRCNHGGERMPDDEAARVREIAERYAYFTRDGQRRPILTAEEIENLTIRRGTLNTREREIIEQHVVTTIDLLSELPFPRTLARVPDIAGSHHERVDGTGYPNRRHRDDITIQGRMLGLADVFEALTAKDRPYKPGRTLSETLEILQAMRAEGAIDPDLHDLFMERKVYLAYAAEHLSPEQIDPAHQEELERYTAGV